MFSFKNRFVYAILCYLLAIGIATVGIPYVLSKTYSRTEAVKIINPVARGDQLQKENLSLVTVGELNLPEGLLCSLDDAIGRYVTVDMVADDFIMAAKISQLPFDGDTLPEELPEGLTAVSIHVKTLEGSIEQEFQSGDIIKLYHFSSQLREIPELQFVQVLSVVQGEKETPILTVLTMTKQAEKLNEMKKAGEIYGALITRGNEILANDLLKQQVNYLEPLKEEK